VASHQSLAIDTEPEPPSSREQVPGGDSPALEGRGLSKSFDDKLANDKVDFAARRGEVRALLGENGAGKTTLISMLCGQYLPDGGAILVNGGRVDFRSPRDALRAGIGVVHQDFRLVQRFTVAENVVLGTSQAPGSEADEAVARVAGELGFRLDPRAHVARLGVGEQQQVEILKLLYRGLDVLILDEPTAVLAPPQAEQLFAALRKLADDGKAVVFITHRLVEVTRAADHVTVLRRGKVVADQPVAGMTHRELAALMVGESVGEAETVESLEAGAPVLEMRGVGLVERGRRVLEDVDLSVGRSEIVGIAGVGGNGQRELAEVAAGMLDHTDGEREVLGDVLAFVPEDRLSTGLVGSMSIAENLAFRRYARPPLSTPLWLRMGQITEFARGLIERFRIPTDSPGLATGKLSGGGLQRVILAREMDRAPDLLVACQPTRGLDVVSARAVREKILEARAAGAGVLFLSEDLDELMEMSDRIEVILGGRLVASFKRGEVSRPELGLRMAGGHGREDEA
jgi:ABC-type uncharacterized transport system ATPase subunit